MPSNPSNPSRARSLALGVPLALPLIAPLLIVLLLTVPFGCAPDGAEEGDRSSEADTARGDASMEIAPDVAERLAKYEPTPLETDLSGLSDEDRQVLGLLIQAGELMDDIFLRQVWSGNPEMAERLEGLEGPRAEDARTFFRVNFGPWDRLADDEPFIGSAPAPPGAGYYPDDMTAEEFETWVSEHPGDAEAFRSLTTVVRRTDDGGLEAIPYSEAYREWLEPAAALLRRAADITTNESLERYLRLRADAFASDDYYESDMAWMDLDAPVEVTIGPYETYEDSLFGYKAAFEAFVTVALPEDSAALDGYKQRLPWLEQNLPIPDEDKNPNRGTESPIRVVDEIYTGGDTKAGSQTIAFNLPNDERVREAKGSKKVLLKNIMRAKYDQILLPIADRVLSPEDRERVSFQAYFDFILHHELSHGLGPGKITLDGRDTEVRLELRDHYSTLEEAKADVMGVYNILALIDEGHMDAALLESLEPTYVAGLFRSARFGIQEAHGQGVAAQFNYLLEKGALEVDEEGRFRTVPEKFPGAIRELLAEILALQAAGDYDGTSRFLERYGQASEVLLEALAKLEEVPVDVRPLYPQAEELAAAVPEGAPAR